MKIKMLMTRTGSNDGKFVRTYYKDHIYDLSDDLGNIFVNICAAVLVNEDGTLSTPKGMLVKDKAIGRAQYENKGKK